MSLKKLSRRSFLAKTGLALGAAALGQALPEGILRLLGKRGLWLPTAYASPACNFDPRQPPPTLGWEPDGDTLRVSVTTGQVLTIQDSAADAHLAFFCELPQPVVAGFFATCSLRADPNLVA